MTTPEPSPIPAAADPAAASPGSASAPAGHQPNPVPGASAATLTPSGLPSAGLSPTDAALIAEACNKSNVLWVRTVGTSRHHLAWHVWHDDAVYVVYGVDEQMLPLLSGQVEVVAKSKDNGSRVVTFVAQADILPARSAEWEAAAAALAASRLNTRDSATQRDRWASGTLVTRLTPLYVSASGLGDDRSEAGAVPAPTEGPTTMTAHQPWHVRGRASTWRARRAARRP